MKTTSKCVHCYHDIGLVFMSDPNKIEEVCCWCGVHRERIVTGARLPEGSHGPYHPVKR